MKTTVQKYAKRQALYYAGMAVLGAVALILGFVMQNQKSMMFGVAIGFLPVGIGGLIILGMSTKNPTMARNIEIESDERNQLIRNKSGNTAFWFAFYFVFMLTVFSQYINLTRYQVGIYTLIFMSIIYFSNLFINCNRY